MRFFDKRVILKYLYDQLTGNFIGFFIGLSATSLVSQFFETRGLKNLWGLAAKKTVIDKSTFANLEWIISIVVGFVVFEIVNKVLREKLTQHALQWRVKLFSFVMRYDLKNKYTAIIAGVANKRIVLFSATYGSVRNTLAKYSKRSTYSKD
jgi:hypothetical protein